jgi:hypothetical protein
VRAEAVSDALQTSLDIRPSEADTPSVDEELRTWKQSRRRHFPWRPFSLMASLCFGVASFALPESVNGIVQWPLYGLAGLSLYLGLSKRFVKSDTDRTPNRSA